MINRDLKDRSALYVTEITRMERREVWVEGFSRGIAVGFLVAILLLAAGWISRHDDDRTSLSGPQDAPAASHSPKGLGGGRDTGV